MKKLHKLAWALSAAAFALTPALTSCNKDDDDKAADLSQGVYQAYEVNFVSSSQANVFATLRSGSSKGEVIRLGSGQSLTANGFSMQYYPMEDGFDYRGTVVNLVSTDGIVTVQLVKGKNNICTNTISADYVSAPDLSHFPSTLKARQDYNIGFTPAAGEKVTMILSGISTADDVYYPTVLADGSFTAPAFTTSGGYNVRVLVSRDKALTDLGTNDAGYIRAVKAAEKPIRIEK